MAEYISREDVIKKIAEVQDKATTGVEDVTYYRAIKIIRDMPIADVQSVKRGKWTLDAKYHIRCSLCHVECLRDDIGITITSAYCPSCGAKMKGD